MARGCVCVGGGGGGGWGAGGGTAPERCRGMGVRRCRGGTQWQGGIARRASGGGERERGRRTAVGQILRHRVASGGRKEGEHLGVVAWALGGEGRGKKQRNQGARAREGDSPGKVPPTPPQAHPIEQGVGRHYCHTHTPRGRAFRRTGQQLPQSGRHLLHHAAIIARGVKVRVTVTTALCRTRRTAARKRQQTKGRSTAKTKTRRAGGGVGTLHECVRACARTYNGHLAWRLQRTCVRAWERACGAGARRRGGACRTRAQMGGGRRGVSPPTPQRTPYLRV